MAGAALRVCQGRHSTRLSLESANELSLAVDVHLTDVHWLRHELDVSSGVAVLGLQVGHASRSHSLDFLFLLPSELLIRSVKLSKERWWRRDRLTFDEL